MLVYFFTDKRKIKKKLNDDYFYFATKIQTVKKNISKNVNNFREDDWVSMVYLSNTHYGYRARYERIRVALSSLGSSCKHINCTRILFGTFPPIISRVTYERRKPIARVQTPEKTKKKKKKTKTLYNNTTFSLFLFFFFCILSTWRKQGESPGKRTCEGQYKRRE